ncbi:hypothetical protein BJ170DRAFT_596644 [Xylariales sp. AK1849]|nr:hypothetical protein BJ170DRAFT_596644 [Xylariales sp. AK1849]
MRCLRRIMATRGLEVDTTFKACFNWKFLVVLSQEILTTALPRHPGWLRRRKTKSGARPDRSICGKGPRDCAVTGDAARIRPCDRGITSHAVAVLCCLGDTPDGIECAGSGNC